MTSSRKAMWLIVGVGLFLFVGFFVAAKRFFPELLRGKNRQADGPLEKNSSAKAVASAKPPAQDAPWVAQLKELVDKRPKPLSIVKITYGDGFAHEYEFQGKSAIFLINEAKELTEVILQKEGRDKKPSSKFSENDIADKAMLHRLGELATWYGIDGGAFSGYALVASEFTLTFKPAKSVCAPERRRELPHKDIANWCD